MPTPDASTGEVTRLLVASRKGDPSAFDRLLPLVYDELRRVARRQLSRHRRSVTLEATGLVHEAYVKLADQTRLEAHDRGHFLAIAARAMRQLIVDHARRRQAEKRGGKESPVPLDGLEIAAREEADHLTDLDEALGRLAAHSERMARVVECRFFAGYSEEETAEALGTSLRTVQREWQKARAWLRVELAGGLDDGSAG